MVKTGAGEAEGLSMPGFVPGGPLAPRLQGMETPPRAGPPAPGSRPDRPGPGPGRDGRHRQGLPGLDEVAAPEGKSTRSLRMLHGFPGSPGIVGGPGGHAQRAHLPIVVVRPKPRRLPIETGSLAPSGWGVMKCLGLFLFDEGRGGTVSILRSVLGRDQGRRGWVLLEEAPEGGKG